MTFDLYDMLGMLSLGFIKPPVKEEEPGIYSPKEIKPVRYSFRPRVLDEYVGQPRAKELIKLNIKKIQTIKPVHFIISGTRGHGKSSLAAIIAKELEYKLHTYVGGSFTMENLREFLNSNNDETNTKHILFIDETHGLPKEVAEFMYSMLEDFVFPSGATIRPFIFIGATTNPEILQKNFSPLVDRCGAQINLEQYCAADIKEILKQYNNHTFIADIDDKIFDILSRNTRYNPRTSIALFDDFLVCKDIKLVLDSHRIVRDSLTTDDIIILTHLTELKAAVGLETLAIIIQKTRTEYQTMIEPFLLSNGYLSRTSKGRIITNKGTEMIRSLHD